MHRRRRQPPLVQDACLAAVIGLACGCAAYWESRGWYPRNDVAYDVAGAVSVLALAARRTAPQPCSPPS